MDTLKAIPGLFGPVPVSVVAHEERTKESFQEVRDRLMLAVLDRPALGHGSDYKLPEIAFQSLFEVMTWKASNLCSVTYLADQEMKELTNPRIRKTTMEDLSTAEKGILDSIQKDLEAKKASKRGMSISGEAWAVKSFMGVLSELEEGALVSDFIEIIKLNNLKGILEKRYSVRIN